MPETTYKNATIRDVAREAGVSTMTVTRAFRRNALIAEKTRKRVMEVAERLNFIPNYNARGLRGSNTMCIGILISNPFANGLVRPLSEALMKDNYVSFISDSLSDTEIVKNALQDFCSRKVTGVILEWRTYYSKDERLMYLLKNLNNVVLYSKEPCKGIAYDACTLNFQPVYRNIVKQLWDKGRRNIVYLGRKDYWRTQVCLKVLEEYGLKESDCLVETSIYPSKPACANYYDALHDRISAGKIPDAVFTSGDVAAAQACSCLNAAGLKIPEDVAVIGNDNSDLGQFCSPPIASIDNNFSQVAETIYKLLMNRINNPGSPIEHKNIECSYVRRRSAAV